jgi:pyrophosphatase PpaX
MLDVDAVLLDLDGTLIDSVPLILESLAHTFERAGFGVPTVEQLLRNVGRPLAPHFSEYTTDPDLVAEMIAIYREHNLSHHDTRVRPFPGIAPVLRAIKAAGMKTVVVTSKHRAGTERGLRVTGLLDLVDAIVPSDEVTHPKPHREPVDRALALTGAEPTRAVFVGDSIHDMASGRAAGVWTGAALWGPFSRADVEPGDPHFWLDAPADLAILLGCVLAD